MHRNPREHQGKNENLAAMSSPEPLQPDVLNPRRHAPKFTHQTPFHHPQMDFDVPEEDLDLIPAELSVGKKPNREPPRPAVAQVHLMLKIKNGHDDLQKEFQDKVPQISNVLGLWSKVKAASPTATGEAQIRARASIAQYQTRTSNQEGQGTIFNLVSHLDSTGQADIIYLTDAAVGSEEHADDSGVPSNLRTVEWLGFDGSYVHVEDLKSQNTAIPTEACFEFDELNIRRNSNPSNLRTREWLNDEHLPRSSQQGLQLGA